jgi:hypothetical protein
VEQMVPGRMYGEITTAGTRTPLSVKSKGGAIEEMLSDDGRVTGRTCCSVD